LCHVRALAADPLPGKRIAGRRRPLIPGEPKKFPLAVTLSGVRIVMSFTMSKPTIDNMKHENTESQNSAALEGVRAFGRHYEYDISYLEALHEASPGAFEAFERAMGLGRYRSA